MRAGNFIISETFILNSPRGQKNIEELQILYELKTAILELIEIYGFHLGNIKEMHEDLHIVEEAIQEAFGFFPDRDYHRFWEWPYCKCPHLDNSDNWGTKFHYYAGDCPVHSEKSNHATIREVRDNHAKNLVELIKHIQGHNMLFNIVQYIYDGLPPEQMREINTRLVEACDEFDI